jgi:hypothetical protein
VLRTLRAAFHAGFHGGPRATLFLVLRAACYYFRGHKFCLIFGGRRIIVNILGKIGLLLENDCSYDSFDSSNEYFEPKLC